MTDTELQAEVERLTDRLAKAEAGYQAERDRRFTEGNDRIWGAGNWLRCAVCPLDHTGHETYHHVNFHKAAALAAYDTAPEAGTTIEGLTQDDMRRSGMDVAGDPWAD